MSDIPVITIEDVRAVAPALAAYTEDAIVNGLWKRTELSARDRSIITVSAMVARERAIGFRHYFNVALNTGVTPSELSEIITHIAFYAGWSTAFSAVAVLKDIFVDKGISIDDLPPVAPEPFTVEEALSGKGVGRAALLHSEFGSIVPGLVEITDNLLYGKVWLRPGLSPRDRNLVTITAFIATGQTEFLDRYLIRAKTMGVTQAEISEVITHLAFYIGWPAAMSSAKIAKACLESDSPP